MVSETSAIAHKEKQRRKKARSPFVIVDNHSESRGHGGDLAGPESVLCVKSTVRPMRHAQRVTDANPFSVSSEGPLLCNGSETRMPNRTTPCGL